MSKQHVALGALFLGLAVCATRTGGPRIMAGPEAALVVLYLPTASPATSKGIVESLVACVAGAITLGASFTEGWACQKLGTSLAKLLRGRGVAS